MRCTNCSNKIPDNDLDCCPLDTGGILCCKCVDDLIGAVQGAKDETKVTRRSAPSGIRGVRTREA